MIIDQLCKKLGFDNIRVLLSPQTQIDADYQFADESGEFVSLILAQVVGVQHGDCEKNEDDKTTPLGHLNVWHFKGGYALNAGVDIVDEADMIDQDVYTAAEMLYGTGGLIGSEDDHLDGFEHDGLYIHAAYIEPKYRGTGLFDLSLRRIIEYCNPVSLGAVVTHPNTDWHPDLKANDPLRKKAKKVGAARLVRRLQSLGFEPHPTDKDWLFFDMEHYDYKWRQAKRFGRLDAFRPRQLRAV